VPHTGWFDGGRNPRCYDLTNIRTPRLRTGNVFCSGASLMTSPRRVPIFDGHNDVLQPAPTVLEPSREASGVVPSPDVAASLTPEGTPQVAPSAVTPPDLVFLQRPGVNIRSAPSGNAPVLGTAPKGTRFTATSREGDWVQVENPNWKGWINSQFLAPNKPL
jgi:hypothetical protein